MLRLQALGGLSLFSETQELNGAALQKRRLALLAALAVSGARGMSRDKLLGLLWPDVDDAHGRQALSQSLYALRKDTGVDLVVGSDVLRLNPDVVTTDIADLEAAIATRRSHDVAALYVGPFLDGIYISGSDEFDRWADLERIRFTRAAERAIEELAAGADARGDYSAAADWWRRLVVMDPLKTRANLGLVTALAASGERVNALRELDAYGDRVRSELGDEPGDAARALAEQLRREEADGAIGNRYVLERELGRGGMAVVYLARDRKHGRLVALKMLHAEYGAAIGRDRLEREIMVTAQMQHPHILPLHDSGEHAGTLYYVMPFVDGETLRDRLTRDHSLSLADAVHLTREIADALEHAHRRGVLHRDIKPENVLLAEGHAMVADFGIAQLISAARDGALTQEGLAVGTPAYMSPEQATGAEQLGPASDLFSLGCVLFEMLAGRPPWIGANARELIAKRFTQPAPRLRTLRPELPAWIDDVTHRLLANDPAMRLSSAAELVRLLADAPRHAPSRLPAPPGELVGRVRETAAAASLLENGEVRLLTFTGAGGTGKTRLALATANACQSHFTAVYFVDLSAISDAGDVEAAIADVLEVRAVEGVTVFSALTSYIGEARLLVVLDNFEQVVSAAPIVVRLVAACPRLSVLPTSRIRLGVRGEHEFFVAPLAVQSDGDANDALAPAVELFVRRAREAQPSVAFDAASIEIVTAICARLDGLPLAIELAAARCRLMTPANILARLEKGFELLTGGARDMPARHQTMRAAIAWSYGLLHREQQDLFTRMAVFAGGCTVAAVEQVCADATLHLDTIDGVEALLDTSLLVREDFPRSGAEPRLRLLETVREFALEQLRAAPDDLWRLVADRHVAWALSFASALAPQLTGADQRDALAALAAEHPNLLAAFNRAIASGDARSALAFAAALWRYFLVGRGLAEGKDVVARALALEVPSDAESLRADAMLGAGQLAQNSGDVVSASRFFEEVLIIRQRQGDRRGEARALADLGWLGWRRCAYPDARRYSDASLALSREIGDERIAALAHGNLGFVNHCEGHLDAALTSYRASLALRERQADERGVAFIRVAIAWTLTRTNQLDDARPLLLEAETTFRALGDERLEAFALDVRAEVSLREGDVAAARALLSRSLPTLRRIGDRWSTAHGLWLSARADLLEGNLVDGQAHAAESLVLRRQIDDHYGVAESLVTQAEIARQDGRPHEADALLRSALKIREEIGDRLGVIECTELLEGLGVTSAHDQGVQGTVVPVGRHA